MNILDSLYNAFQTHIATTYGLDTKTIKQCELTLNSDEKKQTFGDITTNSALILSKKINRPPRDIAQEILNTFKHDALEKIEIAGPGFINIYLKTKAFGTLAYELATQQEAFFKPTNLKKEMVSLEFVSANPTGPLHFGHGRGAIIGDVLAKVLRFLGHTVTAEYYINDAGAQIEKLGISFKIRCQQALGLDVTLPKDAYHGDYLIDLAKECLTTHGKKILEKDDMFFSLYAQDHMLAHIKETLQRYGIAFDVWFSEKSLHESGAIEEALAILENKQLLYQKDDATWFKSTQFSDDKDRVVRKANGSLTYIAADIAYLQNKIDRNHTKLIMILGHDHHSYAQRLQTVLNGLGHSSLPLNIILYQLVKIKDGNLKVRMSKRTGKIISLRDVIETVGTDVARFFYLHRKAEAQLEFDLDLARKKTDENPVYYIQYAYVRTNSILDKASQEEPLHAITPDDTYALDRKEALLLKKIISLKTVLEHIGKQHHTHFLTYYSIELANTFHSYYRHNRVIDLDNIVQSRARLALIGIVNTTFKTVLTLMGISTPQRM